MICERTNTQLPLGNWEGQSEVDRNPRLKSQLAAVTHKLLVMAKRQYDKRYRAINHIRINRRNAAWLKANPDKRRSYQRNWAESHRETQRKINRGFHSRHAERRNKEALERYYSDPNHRKRVIEKAGEWQKEHREHRRQYLNRYLVEWRQAQRENNPIFLIKDRLRSSIKRALLSQHAKKTHRLEQLIGCPPDQLRAHIESQFTGGMSWATRDTWDIDHYVPLSAFDLTNEEEQRWACNWQNLRPLDAHHNAVKSATIPNPLPDWLPVHIADRIRQRTQ